MKNEFYFHIMKLLTLLLLVFVISSCHFNEFYNKYPHKTAKKVRSSVKENKEVYVLEKWDALIFNQSSILLLSDSTFTLDKPYVHRKIHYVKNESQEDKEILKRYAKEGAPLDTSNVEYHCEDCDAYLIYKLYKSTSEDLIVDTLYIGEFP